MEHTKTEVRGAISNQETLGKAIPHTDSFKSDVMSGIEELLKTMMTKIDLFGIRSLSDIMASLTEYREQIEQIEELQNARIRKKTGVQKQLRLIGITSKGQGGEEYE